MKFLIFDIEIITKDVIDFYKNNKDIAKTQYDKLINKAKERGLDKSKLNGYYEKHHIKPRCLDGNNENDNLVLLTYREHILAHLLLYTINLDNQDLFLSFSLLVDLRSSQEDSIEVDLLALDSLKSTKSEFMKNNNPMKNPEIAKKVSKKKKGMEGFFKGKHHSEETKQKLRDKTLSLNFSGTNHPMYGKKHTEEARKKMSDKLKGEKHPLYGKHLKESTKQKLSKAHNNPVISPEGIEYESIKVAAKAIGVSRPTLSNWIRLRPEKGWKKKNS